MITEKAFENFILQYEQDKAELFELFEEFGDAAGAIQGALKAGYEEEVVREAAKEYFNMG